MAKYKAYPEYKDSGVEWLGKIPEHWQLSKLRYMFTFGKGLTITKENLQDEGIPCVNYGEVHSKYGFEVDPQEHPLKCVSETYLKNNTTSLLIKGDVVFADTSEDIEGSGNFTQLISNVTTFAGYHTIIARPLKRNNSRFYAYLLDCKELRAQVRHAVKGVKVFSITQAILRNISIWLPSENEQGKISAFLNHETAKIDNLIEKQQQLIELLKEKRQAVISHAVNKGLNPNVPMKDSGIEWLGEVPEHWVISQLKSNVSTRKGIAFKSTDFSDSGIRVVKASDIKKKTIHCSDVFLPEKFSEDYPKAILKFGDIVLSTVGSNPDVKNSAVGQLGYIPIELDGALLNQNTVVFSSSSNVLDQFYLFFLIQTDVYRDHLDLHAHGTANQASLNVSDMLDFKYARPPLSEQVEIVEYIQNYNLNFDNLEAHSEAAIKYLQERRTALISAAVTGKIDVRDWVAPVNSEMANIEESPEVNA
ncbi:restriction endonuclease subunit S [Pectobacterium parmentieri]|uniref:Restriction endonuclease subunit S n=1 Tax=Pectobacterium parmentieri TaxID=1905730 RepID=A0A8B3FMU5_PECPM|nr:restriction endonuclease subunit S [Pectobacterium parmentieri]AOR60409.1 restriction endonuclease subunit S [Pectobacterium parmentieri]AYH08643.1 restriction endonuclease subunit S [Pectobacterium parmentieri]AYH20614.1 restriction endonuclease subunit S [Pectobacterium parmentieri]AYH35010.1 restriction endonuclease subunit S [Pectobacterium parmentieri]AZS55076.1 restriction endonuclease subunit S [Pectobacterium parmentieri]